ncbi:MAG: Asp-tRNA(Asn)/Glu-tRNA(Gln) amidotransferase subunit GatA [Gemmatimonadota bacterium]
MPSIAELKRRLEDGELTAVELVSRTLDAVEEAEAGPGGLHAFLSLRRQLALAEAEAADWEREEGIELGPLAGIPVAVKDNIAVAEGPTTAGSRILEGFVPPYDAGAVARLKHAGAIVIGKTNLDEFAMGSSTENSAFGPTLNPHDRTRVPGGSSGGSAAAVAAGYVPAALGSDTGGSIRQPAAFCGVVGVKPTYERVSRYGLVAFASSLDQIGPLATSVEDAARVLSAISGHDPLDSTCAPRPVPDYAHALRRPLRGLRVGVPREYFAEGLDPEVREVCDRTLERLREAGAQVREVSLPRTAEGIAAYYVVATAEASSNLARYDGVRYGFRAADAEDLQDLYLRTRHEGFGPEVRRRIMLGTYVLSAGYYDAYYRTARRVRALIASDFERAFGDCHCLLTPTTPTPPFRLGEKTDDPLAMYLADVYTVAVNLAGIPAVSVPAGSAAGLPGGVQLIGPPWSEERLLNVAWHVENADGEAQPELGAAGGEDAERAGQPRGQPRAPALAQARGARQGSRRERDRRGQASREPGPVPAPAEEATIRGEGGRCGGARPQERKHTSRRPPGRRPRNVPGAAAEPRGAAADAGRPGAGAATEPRSAAAGRNAEPEPGPGSGRRPPPRRGRGRRGPKPGEGAS